MGEEVEPYLCYIIHGKAKRAFGGEFRRHQVLRGTEQDCYSRTIGTRYKQTDHIISY